MLVALVADVGRTNADLGRIEYRSREGSREATRFVALFIFRILGFLEDRNSIASNCMRK